MRVKAYVNTGFVGCRHEEVLEFEDDATDEEIEEWVREWMYDRIEWGWSKEE